MHYIGGRWEGQVMHHVRETTGHQYQVMHYIWKEAGAGDAPRERNGEHQYQIMHDRVEGGGRGGARDH
jgi:hypothetical protein